MFGGGVWKGGIHFIGKIAKGGKGKHTEEEYGGRSWIRLYARADLVVKL